MATLVTLFPPGGGIRLVFLLLLNLFAFFHQNHGGLLIRIYIRISILVVLSGQAPEDISPLVTSTLVKPTQRSPNGTKDSSSTGEENSPSVRALSAAAFFFSPNVKSGVISYTYLPYPRLRSCP